MKAISVKQPYGWLILNGGKDFENRGQYSSFIGNILIHVSKVPSEFIDLIRLDVRKHHKIEIPATEELDLGGIAGVADFDHFVRYSESKWSNGSGYPIKATQVLPFKPWKGKQGFWDFPDHEFLRLLNRAMEEHPDPETLRRDWGTPGDFTGWKEIPAPETKTITRSDLPWSAEPWNSEQ